MRMLIVVAVAGSLAACGSHDNAGEDTSPSTAAAPGASAPSAVQPAAAPDLATCPRREPVDEGMRARTKPIPVPPPLNDIMRSDMDNLAVVTLDGGTTCV